MTEVRNARTMVLTTGFLSLCLTVSAASAQKPVGDTLPPFDGVRTAKADSSKLVAAASDALQGQSSVTVPMVVLRLTHEPRAVVVELAPIEDGKVKWLNRGGRVRILADGRRVVLSRK